MRLAVLGFHKIGEPSNPDWATWNYISVARFAHYLEILREDGWLPLDAETFVEALSVPGALPRRTALLTFDDGYRSTLTEALPRLRRFGYPAVVFVPTAFVGGQNTFDREIEPDEAICSWTELRELEQHGVSVQSHGVTHRALSELDRAAIGDELAHSKASIERELGKPVELFAYPYGDAGAAGVARPMLEELGYRAGFLYGGRPFTLPGEDRYALARVALGPDSDLRELLREL